VSAYDTLCYDRAVFGPSSLAGRVAYHLDRTACRVAGYVLLDTPLQTHYFVRTFGLDPERLSALPVGCNEDIFRAQPLATAGECLRVLFYCTYLPLHGADVVVRAAALLRDEPFSLKLIGSGPQYRVVKALAARLDTRNISFAPPVPVAALGDEIAAADVCLGGHFGGTDKAGRTVPGKVYQILAVGRPLVAGDTPANRDLLHHGESAYFVPPGDHEALAVSLRHLRHDQALRERLARSGRDLYQGSCSEAVITRQLEAISTRLVSEVG